MQQSRKREVKEEAKKKGTRRGLKKKITKPQKSEPTTKFV
jgi:hypothetical protein